MASISLGDLVAGLIGGSLIGAAALLLLLANGRLAGVSSAFAGVFRADRDAGWRRAFVLGLLAGGALLLALNPQVLPTDYQTPLASSLAAGLLVGFGTQLGRGCTSGHGVCGIGRGSTRSMVATVTFMATGAITVWMAGGLS